MQPPIVIKLSGHHLQDHVYLSDFANIIRDLAEPLIIVHGGGAEITTLQQKLGIEPKFIDGVRVTDEASLQLVEMVMCGTVNKRIVRNLTAVGLDALGISGVDRNLIQAKVMVHPHVNMGFTGEVITVDAWQLQTYLQAGIHVVLAPICAGDGTSLNVNADHVAGAIAGELSARRLIFLSNIPGVLDAKGNVIPSLTPQGVEELIAEGVITDGMIPKVHMATQALHQGTHHSVITDLAGLQNGTGTIFHLVEE